jgi:hypothetical protein
MMDTHTLTIDNAAGLMIFLFGGKMHHTMVAPIFKYTYVDRFEGRGTPSDVQWLHLFQYRRNG